MIRKIQMYILSLWLLFLLMAIKAYNYIPWDNKINWKENLIKQCVGNLIPICSMLFLLLGFYFYLRFRYITKGSTKLPKIITKIEDQNYEHLTFLTTYLVPFLRFGSEGKDLVISILLLVIIGAIFIKTQLFYKNPTLALLGYKIYKVDTESSIGLIFISKDFLKIGDKVHHMQLEGNIYFVKL